MTDQTTSKPNPKAEERSYKKTLNLPKTTFPMRGNLVQNEPASLKRWHKMDLYAETHRLRADESRPENKGQWVFHDGPPYANGSIHLGHMLNKVLKDLVVRSKTMGGYDVPFTPGWDCHGLPIEHRVMMELVESGKMEKINSLSEDNRRMAVRRECQKYALKYQKLQTTQMKRLLTQADYDKPYLTMTPNYEAATLEVFADMVSKGIVYRSLKPVHWSIANQTALAEAELEYYDREDVSVFVDFEVKDAAALAGLFNADEAKVTGASKSAAFMIWTTTPWTLPANLAVAVHPRIQYALVLLDGRPTVLAEELVESVAKHSSCANVEVLGTCAGKTLLGVQYQHPFCDRVSPVVQAEYVTLEDGTGLVHTAPGHGQEDYQTGLANGLDIYCPVLEDGTMDDTAPEWLRGKTVWEANDLVIEHLRASGHLFHDHKFTHSYPHDWRGKTPVIFRATEQWFISVDGDAVAGKGTETNLRKMALEAVDNVAFHPAWGFNRMRGMLESRPDWCLSRQRAWGLPIPAFKMENGDVLLTEKSVRAVSQAVREKGSDLWFTGEPADILTHYDPATDPNAPDGLDINTLTKMYDIFDVWFESGSSWNAVMRESGAGYPINLYLEGSDQHRGWFQLSLLCGLGATGQAPFRELLTHGFMVAKDGHKMSKSLGNTLDVEDLMKTLGADVCRWWVAGLNYENDIKVDLEFFKVAGESYRKVRNTLRFLLSNLDDFTPSTDECSKGCCVALCDFPATSIDAWVLGEYNKLATKVIEAYNQYHFKSAQMMIYNFCNDTLSAVYCAAVKDRLYCDTVDSPRRRRCQTTMWELLDGLTRLLAPILPHTADESFRALWKVEPKDTARCVHLTTFITSFDVGVAGEWDLIMARRDEAMGTLEQARTNNIVENPLDAMVRVADPDGVLAAFAAKTQAESGEDFLVDFADLLGVSRVEFVKEGDAEVVSLMNEPRCERSWKRDGTVKERPDGGQLSDRDANALGL